MSNIKYLIKIGEKAKIASAQLSQLDNKEKNKVLSDFLSPPRKSSFSKKK